MDSTFHIVKTKKTLQISFNSKVLLKLEICNSKYLANILFKYWYQKIAFVQLVEDPMEFPQTCKTKIKFCLVLCCAYSLIHVRLFATPWTVVHQALLSMGILQARILEWIARPSSRGFSQPKDWTQVSPHAGGFLSSEPPEKPKFFFIL